MLAICIEASHARGMGHLFRALNFIQYLKEKNEAFIVLINDDKASLKILKDNDIPFETVDFNHKTGQWESSIIHRYKPDVWLNDKFESSYSLCRSIKSMNIPLAVIDDRGKGAELSDIHFAGMMFGEDESNLPGKRILKGLEYNILNPEIAKYKRHRSSLKRVIVTLGGSDTYGATVPVVRILKKKGIKADIILGANFRHHKELSEVADGNYNILKTVPSLMEKFGEYDLAITGGGVTPIEANAAGLPCIIIANEEHEIATGKFLESLGGSIFAGYYRDIQEERFDIDKLDIGLMSEKAMDSIPLTGAENIFNELIKEIKG